ncbi:MAG: molybdate ABC transporter substrate-binding protein [Cellvibrionaceae bacterium]
MLSQTEDHLGRGFEKAMNKHSKPLLVLWLLISAAQLMADEVANVAVASNFSTPMKALVTQFEQNYSGKIRASYASSGKLFAQIQHGAPFHVMLSADEKIPAALVEKNLAEESSRFTYAIGALVFWSPNSDDALLARRRLMSMKFDRLALANPKHAPYGRAAIETLRVLGLEAMTKKRRVTGENIAQTYHFVSTGNAETGFVARSQLATSQLASSSNTWLVPSEYHSAIKQDAVLLRRGRNNRLAIDFLRYLRSESALEIIRQYGYHVADAERVMNGK